MKDIDELEMVFTLKHSKQVQRYSSYSKRTLHSSLTGITCPSRVQSTNIGEARKTIHVWCWPQRGVKSLTEQLTWSHAWECLNKYLTLVYSSVSNESFLTDDLNTWENLIMFVDEAGHWTRIDLHNHYLDIRTARWNHTDINSVNFASFMPMCFAKIDNNKVYFIWTNGQNYT